MPGPKILVVDDNKELVNLLSRFLEAEGFTPVTALRGRAALDAIPAQKPAAAIVDVLLPDMMGYDVAVALKKASIPFLFVSGVFKGGRSAIDAHLNHGAAGYFEKPFEAKKLVDSLRALLPAPPPSRAAPPTSALEASARDFDVEVPVESDEPIDPMDLTGRVSVTEDGRFTATIEGAPIHARSVGVPARPPPIPVPPAPATEVRAAAAAAVRRDPAPAPEGALADRLPDLVTAFHLARHTGELTLQRGKVRKTVYFERGRPCYAISNLVSDRFGPFLVRAGKITAAQLELCTAAADKTGKRTGDVLAEMGLLKETEKIYLVAQQVKSIIYSTFAWEDGEYRLHFTDRAAKEAMKLDLHPANLIVRGVKKLYKPERLFRLLSPEDRLIPGQDPAYDLHDVAIEEWEAQLLSRVDGTRTMAELIRLAKRTEAEVYGFLYAMVALRILERR